MTAPDVALPLVKTGPSAILGIAAGPTRAGAIVRNMRSILGIAVVVALIAGAGWYALRPVVVATVVPTRGNAAEVVYATGVIEPRNWAQGHDR